MNKVLNKKEFVEFLTLAEDIDNKLEGKSHIISRRKLREDNGYYINELNDTHFFQTFHSLAAKILPKYSTVPLPVNFIRSKLSGDDMYVYIDKAAAIYSAVKDLKDIEVKPYYIAIRLYENGHTAPLANLEGGYEIYDMYQSFMGINMDWEESITHATHYLKYDLVTSIEDLPNRYIIVDANALLTDGNENIVRFYAEFYNWCTRHSENIDFYLLKNNKMLTYFVKGIKHGEIHVEEWLDG